jgi:zinc protease
VTSPEPLSRSSPGARRRRAPLVAFAALLVASLFGPPAAGSNAWAGASRTAQKKGKGQGPKKGKPKGGGAKEQPAPPAAKKAAAPPIELNLAIQRVTLDNGLRVVLNVDHTSPTVAVNVAYDIGSREEQRGRSGFAHLFEHLMFQGSKNLAKGEHFTLVSSHGGVLNGSTSPDRTKYFEVLPANELDLALWLEADRMKSLDVSEQNFENQRKVVEEEYRMRVQNLAYAPSEIRLGELVYQGYWPYEHSAIGLMDDLEAAKLEWALDFHAHHYGPNVAVLTVAGDIDPDEALASVHRYFDGAAKVEAQPFADVELPEQTSQRTAVVKDDNARTPGVLYGWATPPMHHPDHAALELAALLLAGGESSRLHQLLVRDKSLAQRVSADLEGRRGPDLFSIDVRLADGAKVGDVEKAVEAEVKNLATRGPSDAEMEKAHRQAQASLVLGLQSNAARASRLSDFELFFGDARQLNAELPRYLAVTKDDVKRVAAQDLGPTRRTIVETYPSSAPMDEKPVEKKKAAPPAARASGKADKGAKKKPAAAGKPKKQKTP